MFALDATSALPCGVKSSTRITSSGLQDGCANYCPPGIDLQIAEHACQKYSGRVGRSAGAKNLDEKEIGLAVIAHIRHTQTNYDELLAKGYERAEARSIVNDRIDKVLESWRRANKN